MFLMGAVRVGSRASEDALDGAFAQARSAMPDSAVKAALSGRTPLFGKTDLAFGAGLGDFDPELRLFRAIGIPAVENVLKRIAKSPAVMESARKLVPSLKVTGGTATVNSWDVHKLGKLFERMGVPVERIGSFMQTKRFDLSESVHLTDAVADANIRKVPRSPLKVGESEAISLKPNKHTALEIVQEEGFTNTLRDLKINTSNKSEFAYQEWLKVNNPERFRDYMDSMALAERKQDPAVMDAFWKRWEGWK
jgi:hypothetical protein